MNEEHQPNSDRCEQQSAYHHVPTINPEDEADQDHLATAMELRQHRYPRQPLPLEDPSQYLKLVRELYSSSTAMILGNMLEWLDFGIYGYSESEISQQLFAGSTAAGWATFGLGYAFRPIGALVLGHWADTKSRNLSFLVAISGMACSTAGMAVLPAVCGQDDAVSYCVRSIWKTALPAILLRCVQGFSAGAAAGGVNVIQSELWSTPERKGALAQSVGVNNVSGSAASMLSAAVVFGLRALFGESKYAAWGWRVAFLVVVPPSALAAFLLTRRHDCRRNGSSSLSNAHVIQYGESDSESGDEGVGRVAIFRPVQIDSELDQEVQATTATDNDQTPTTLVPYWLLIILSIFIHFSIASYNNLNIYMVQYAKDTYKASAEMATLMAVTGKAVQVGMTPFAALLGDSYGWFGACGLGGILCSLVAMPMMAANRLGNKGGDISVVWALVSGVFPIVSTIWILNAPLLATSIFPVETRSRDTSFVMALGTALAGFFPLLLDEISSNGPLQDAASGGVLAAIAALGAIGIFWIRNRAREGRVKIYQRPELF